MKLKSLVLVVALLVAACVAVYFVRRPAPPPASDPRVGQPVLDPQLAARAAGVTIATAGHEVVLRKSGDRWIDTSYHELPADVAKLSSFVDEFANGRIQRLVTTRPERIERLGLGEVKITLRDDKDAVLWETALGRTAEAGGRFVRYGPEQKVYLAPVGSYIDGEPKNWADTSLLNVPASEVARVSVTLPSGEVLAAERAKAGDAWKRVGDEKTPLKDGVADGVITDFAALRFSEVRKADDPEAAAAFALSPRTVQLKTFGGEEFTLKFFRRPEEKRPKPAAAPTAEPAAAPPAAQTPALAPAPSPKPAPAAEPQFETIPAGPVFVKISSSKADARINETMKKGAFQISEWTFERLPKATADWAAADAKSKAQN